MNSAIEFRSPDAGYDDPVGMWLACHQRVKRFAAMLGRVGEHVAAVGADEEAQRAAASIRRYFNEAAPRHHEDEEEDLFPLLRERADSNDSAALTAMDDIEAEHLELGALWRRVDLLLERICAGERVAIEPQLAARFATSYDRHIAIEEDVILPALRRALRPADWQQVGRAMAERRGLEWNTTPAATAR